MKRSLDPVHDLQRAFRKLVTAYSFPGRLADLSAEAEGLEPPAGWPALMPVLAWMLLDAETSFHCADPVLGDRLAMVSFSARRPLGEADFAFCAGSGPDFGLALERAKAGSLADPHLSATVVASADFSEAQPLYKLTGPGIETSALCRIGLAPGWLGLREGRNREFPLGLDLILVDAGHRLLALPRSVRVEEAA